MLEMLLSSQEFKGKYSVSQSPITTESSKVYLEESYAVKVSEIDWILPDIAFSKRFNHPCILSADSFCFEEVNGKFMGRCLFSKGVDVLERVKSVNDVRRLCFDILDALLYIQSRGCVHGDIKPDNIVFIESTQRYGLIDLGMCKRVVLSETGPSVEGISYTLAFRDFQFMGNINSTSCEVFAFGQTIRCVALGLECIYDSSFNLERFVHSCIVEGDVQDIAELGRFIESCICISDNRKTLKQLASSPFLSSNVPLHEDVLDVVEFSSKMAVGKKTWYSAICDLVFKECIALEMTLECLFLIIHNIRRTPKAMSTYDLDVFVSVHVYIVVRSLRAPIYRSFSDLKDSNINAISSIMRELNFTIMVLTEWDYCCTVPQLVQAFRRLLSENYTFKRGTLTKRHCLCTVKSFMSTIYYESCHWESLMNCVEKEVSHKQCSIVDVESSFRRKVEDSMDRNIFRAVKEYFDPREDNGFLYFFINRILTDKEASNFVARRISSLHTSHIERYYKILSKSRLMKIKNLTKARLSDLCLTLNLLSCDEWMIR